MSFRALLIHLTITCSCAPSSDVTPEIAVSPGYAARIAVMDRFRLHDEDRKHMMQRPRVWIEELPDDEPLDGGAPSSRETRETLPAPPP